MSRMENVRFFCVWLVSFVVGGFAYGGAHQMRWLHSWREVVAVCVGFAVTILVMRGICDIIEEREEHKREQASEKERRGRAMKQQEAEEKWAAWRKECLEEDK